VRKTSFIIEREISKPQDFMEHLNKYKVHYKEFEKIEGEHDGSSPKSFVLLDDSLSGTKILETQRTMQDSRYFSYLFHEIQSNPNTSLVTYLNSTIKEGVFPRYVSCLAKNCIFDQNKRDTIDDGRNASEIIGSRIAEMLGVPTSYCVGVPAEDGTVGTVLSVDFLAYGETFDDILSMSEGKSNLESSDYAYKWEDSIRDALKKKYLTGLDSDSLYRLERCDLPLTMLFRKGGLFKDADMASYNVGIVMKGDEFRLAPNFDMECLLTTMKISPNYYEVDYGAMRDVVSHSASRSPNMLRDFVARVNETMVDGSLPGVIEEYYPNKKVARNIVENLRTTVLALNQTASKYITFEKER